VLARLQKQLTDFYQVDRGLDVRDYLITDPVLAEVLGKGALMPNTDESVLLSQDEDGLALSVYLDREMLDRLEESSPLDQLQVEQLNDFWMVLESVSHFNYIVWSASKDRPMTLLELEMQAEVDKFVTSMLLAAEQGDNELVNQLHVLLFDAATIKSDLDREQHERYAAASEYAGRFCHRLRTRFLESGDAVRSELRRFYRLSQAEKISHIHTQAWSSV